MKTPQTRCGWSGAEPVFRISADPGPVLGPVLGRVCEGALDRRGAEVLCRELGCGAPLLQGALSPLGQTFHCEGNESKLMDCNRTRTGPETCPTLNLTCKEPLRLVGGASRCEGTVEVELRGEWRQVGTSFTDRWDLEAAAVVCRDRDCGSPVSTEKRVGSDESKVWLVTTHCVKKSSAVRDCLYDRHSSPSLLQVICSEPYSLRLVDGNSRCQGHLQVQRAGQDWTEVRPLFVPLWFGNRACAELDCGSALSLEEKRVSSREAVQLFPFFCLDSSLIDCFYSNTDPSPVSLELTCSDSVRLVGGGACVQDLCRSRTSPWPSPGPGSVRGLGPSRGRGAVQGAGLWGSSPPGALSPLGRRSTVRETSLS
uniref:SRCR domain-containing protein n=2 Tax=Neogobius melanostomus TaxID=47308 RepID=A0A8C6UYX8_9GOBI